MIPKIATVTAEDAPLGVQLWPTWTPEAAPNFTLERVETVRSEAGTYVLWIYQSGNKRLFSLGESVAVDGEALGEWMSEGMQQYHEAQTWALATGAREVTVVHERVDYSSGVRGEVTETGRSTYRRG